MSTNAELAEAADRGVWIGVVQAERLGFSRVQGGAPADPTVDYAAIPCDVAADEYKRKLGLTAAAFVTARGEARRG